jgi:hypothetical protein
MREAASQLQRFLGLNTVLGNFLRLRRETVL